MRVGLFFALFAISMAFSSLVHGADYYVSTSGEDNATGKKDSPFKRIQQAADVMQAGDTCIIRGGTYRETVTVANSGEEGKAITFRAASGERVVISGLEPVDAWSKQKGNVYAADLAWSLDDEDQVFMVNGKQVTYFWEARWPNINEHTLHGLSKGLAIAEGGSKSTLVDTKRLKRPNQLLKGATIWYIGGKGGWLAQTSRIKGFNSNTGTFLLEDEDETSEIPVKGSDYYITGILDELDMAKEWYIDQKMKKIYLWVPGGGVPKDIEVKKRVQGFVVENKSYINLEGVHFLASNIQLRNTEYCTINRIDAQYVYYSDQSRGYMAPNQYRNAIFIEGKNNVIKNSTLAQTSGSMVYLKGEANRVENNNIFSTTQLGNYASSVYLASGSKHRVSHNTIRDVGRCAIMGKGTEKAILQNNHVYNFMWLSSDGGAFYFYGMDMGNAEIRYNIIHDGKGISNNYGKNGHGHKATHGIYADAMSHNVLIHHNVVYNVGDKSSSALRFNRSGNYRLIYNNTFIDNIGGSFSMYKNRKYMGDLFACVITNNIMTDSVTEHEDILFSNNIRNKAGLKMVDPTKHNYRLRNGSTAVDAGIMLRSISKGFVGDKADVGAYELAKDWGAGHDFKNLPNPDYTRSKDKFMNLLAGSGGFDTMEKWKSLGSARAVSIPTGKAGLKAGHIRGISKLLRLKGQSGARVEQTVSDLRPSTKYRLSGWAFVENGESLKFGVRSQHGQDRQEKSVSANNTIYDKRKDVFFTTGSNQTEITVFIEKTSSGSGAVYADDFGLLEQ